MRDGRRAGRASVAGGPECGVTFEQPDGGTLLVRLSGNWRLEQAGPSPEGGERRIESTLGVRRVAFDTQTVGEWDSRLLTFLNEVIAAADGRHVDTDLSGLPAVVQHLLRLADAVPPRTDTGAPRRPPSWLARIGTE